MRLKTLKKTLIWAEFITINITNVCFFTDDIWPVSPTYYSVSFYASSLLSPGVICSPDTDSSAALLNTACLFNYGKQELCIFSQACQFNITEARTYSPTPKTSGFSWVDIFICTHHGRWVALKVSRGSVHSRAGRKTSQRVVCGGVLGFFLCQEGGFAHVIVKDISTVTVEREEFLVFVVHALLRIQTTGTRYNFFILFFYTHVHRESIKHVLWIYVYIERLMTYDISIFSVSFCANQLPQIVNRHLVGWKASWF